MRRRCCTRARRALDERFFRALCDPNRVTLLVRLAGCAEPRTVSELNACCQIDVSVVSRHLAILREAGIVAARKCGREVYYKVDFARLVGALREMADAMEACRVACGETTKECCDE